MRPARPPRLQSLIREVLTTEERSMLMTALETEAKLRHEDERGAIIRLGNKLGFELCL